ncbi:MAG: DUF2914 domain-containing protein [Gammaproteobacteria bacterium]
MTDKRNIVIQVKYPVSGKTTVDFEPRMITEWNIKRLLLAAGILLLILVSLFYIINIDTQVTGADNTTEKQPDTQAGLNQGDIKGLDISARKVAETNSAVKSKNELNKENARITAIPVKKSINERAHKQITKDREGLNSNEIRTALTYEINNKEPVGEIVGTVNVNNKKPIWIYYFTELKAMKGSKVYHEWSKDGVVVTKRALTISGNRWRTSSRMLFSDAEAGNWAVRMFDINGRLLNEKKFKVK